MTYEAHDCSLVVLRLLHLHSHEVSICCASSVHHSCAQHPPNTILAAEPLASHASIVVQGTGYWGADGYLEAEGRKR